MAGTATARRTENYAGREHYLKRKKDNTNKKITLLSTPPKQTKIQQKISTQQPKQTKSLKPPKAKDIPTQKCTGGQEESACSESCQDSCTCTFRTAFSEQGVAVFNFSPVVWFCFGLLPPCRWCNALLALSSL